MYKLCPENANRNRERIWGIYGKRGNKMQLEGIIATIIIGFMCFLFGAYLGASLKKGNGHKE
jgi:hypothetical protein